MTVSVRENRFCETEERAYQEAEKLKEAGFERIEVKPFTKEEREND